MKFRKEIEIDIRHDEVDQAIMEASPFDKLSIMIRLARTITKEDIDEIKELLPLALNPNTLTPIKELVQIIEG